MIILACLILFVLVIIYFSNQTFRKNINEINIKDKLKEKIEVEEKKVYKASVITAKGVR